MDVLTSSWVTCGANGFLGTQFGNLWLSTLPMAFLVCVTVGPANGMILTRFSSRQQQQNQLGSCGQMLLPKSSTCWFSRRPAEVGHKGLALWGDGQRLQVSLGQQLGENFPLGHPQGGLAPGATTGGHRLRPCCPCGMDPMSPRAWHCLLME